MAKLPKIETNELILRHMTKEDEGDFINLLGMSAINKFSPFGKIDQKTANAALKIFMENYKNKKFGFWGVIEKKKHKFTGFAGHHSVMFEDDIYEMLFWEFHPNFLNTELYYQSIKLTCQNAFENAGHQKLIFFIHPEDDNSLKCAQYLKAKYEKDAMFFGVKSKLYSLNSGIS